MKYLTVTVTLLLIGCATQPIDMHSAATSELLERQAAIDRKVREDDFGVDWGMTRWISHAAEKNSVLKEKAAIDAELAHRHVTGGYPIATARLAPSSPLARRPAKAIMVPSGDQTGLLSVKGCRDRL